MEIHHYTSIENLALILKNKTIRFTRLDKVDDSEEAGLSCKNIQLSYYTFVSCWTDSEEESIPLWKMYAGKEMHGIRISLEEGFMELMYIRRMKKVQYCRLKR